MKALDRQILAATAKRYISRHREKSRTGLFPLEELYLYVTMRCNAKCDHCFCWEDLNVGIPEMTLEQLTTVAETVTPLELIVMTGGEPMLRRDLLEVMTAFAERGKVQALKINTNGLNPDKIEKLAIAFKERFPHVGLGFQLSLDGLDETHDRIRGVPGNFRKVIETLKRLEVLSHSYPALQGGVLTVVTDLNYKELVALNDYLRQHISPDVGQGFELVRDVRTTAWKIPEEISEKGVGPKNMAPPPVSAFPEIAEAYRLILARSPVRASAFHVHNLAQLRAVETGQEQIKCKTAGQANGVVYTNGDVAACEFTLPFAKLSDFDYDFMALWKSRAADERRAQLGECYCIHGCYIGKSVEYSLKGLAKMAMEAL